MKFLNQGFARSLFSGAMNNLLWCSYVIMLSLYASAFSSYAPKLFEVTGSQSGDFHLYVSAIIVLATGSNYYSVAIAGRVASCAVIVKLIDLLVCVGFGIYGLVGNSNLHQRSDANWGLPLNRRL